MHSASTQSRATQTAVWELVRRPHCSEGPEDVSQPQLSGRGRARTRCYGEAQGLGLVDDSPVQSSRLSVFSLDTWTHRLPAA